MAFHYKSSILKPGAKGRHPGSYPWNNPAVDTATD